MNKKSLLGFLFISLLLASFIFSSNLVLAQDNPNEQYDSSLDTDEKVQANTVYGSVEEYRQAFGVDQGPEEALPKTSSDSSSFTMERLKNLALVDLWLKGYSSSNFSIAGELVKILLLIMIVLLVYSGFSYANFLGEFITRPIISLIIGILATFLISTESLLTSLTSFTALGTALWIFLPILALTFFTILVSSSAAPFGIFIQKILWVIYSVYTFISGLVILSLSQSKAGNAVGIFLKKYIITPLYGNSELLTNMSKAADTPTAILLMVVSVLVFWIAVIKGDFFEAWLAKEKRNADLMRFQDSLERQAERRKLEAEGTQE